jgi:hypothetical protein
MKGKFQKIKILYIVFFVVLLAELVGAVIGLFSGNEEFIDISMTNIFLVFLTTIALVIPWAIEVRYKVDIPDVLEFVILAMLFISIVLGFLHDYYGTVPGFDKITHALSGVTIALLSLQTIYFLNRYEKVKLKMGPGITSIYSFTFSMTLLVIWEFYEFLADTIKFNINPETSSNMQRYQWINDLAAFPQDYGLYDTMIDLFVGSLGALIVALAGYFLIRNKPIYIKEIDIK